MNSSLTSCAPDQEHILLTSDNVSLYTYSRGDTTVICIIMPVILTIGVLGNGAFLLVVARVEWMRQVSSNIYLACLAVVDITFIAVAVGVKLSRFLASPIVIDESVFGVPGCVSLYFISDLCFFVSHFLITLVAVERYTAVCRPFAFRSTNGSSRKRLAVIGRITGCWVLGSVAACLLIPDRLLWNEICISGSPPDDFEHLPQIVGSCGSVVGWYFYFSNCVQVVPFFTTMFINFTLYALIARKLHQQGHTRREQCGVVTQEQTRTRNQITRMLIINGTTYFVFLVPFEAMVLALTITGVSSLPPLLTRDQHLLALNICRCLLYVNSAINPFIYTLTSPVYRRAFVNALCLYKTQYSPAQNLTGLSNLPRTTGQDNERRQ